MRKGMARGSAGVGQNSLFHFWSQKKHESSSDDDCVLIVKEVKINKTSNIVKTEPLKPKRLNDVLRKCGKTPRKKTIVAHDVLSTRPVVCEPAIVAHGVPSTRPVVCEPAIVAHDVPSTRPVVCEPAIVAHDVPSTRPVAVEEYISPEKLCDKTPVLSGVERLVDSDTETVDSSTDGVERLGDGGGVRSRGPDLSLRILDSQNYFSESEGESDTILNSPVPIDQSQPLGMDTDQSQMLDMNVDLLACSNEFDGKEIGESAPLEMDTSLLIAENPTTTSRASHSPMISTHTSSDNDSDVSVEDVFSCSSKKEREKGRTIPSVLPCARRKSLADRRNEVTRQLFTDGKHTAGRGGNTHSLRAHSPNSLSPFSPSSMAISSTAIVAAAVSTPYATASFKSISVHGGVQPKMEEIATGAGRITPDSDLEEMMLSLTESTTVSPPKNSSSSPKHSPSPPKHSPSSRKHSPSPPKHSLSAATAVVNNGLLLNTGNCTAHQSMDTLPSSSNTTRTNTRDVPYYLANILNAMDQVLTSPIDSTYFDDIDDVAVIAAFHSLSAPAQMLYTRLLCRQHDWIQTSKMKYEEINNIPSALQELKAGKLVEDNRGELSLEVLLNMLSVPKLKKICKHMKIADNLKRAQLIHSMIQHSSQKSISSMFHSIVSTEHVMIKRVKKEIPECYRLLDHPRDVFMRILMLYSLVLESQTPGRHQTASQLIFEMLKENAGMVKYPQLPLNRESRIFLNRDYVVKMRHAQEVEDALSTVLQKKDYESGVSHVEELKGMFSESLEDEQLVEHDTSLPAYLLRYTLTSQIIRCLLSAAELLEKMRRWREAVELYQLILRQRTYKLYTRGHCYDRLCLLLDFHLKDKREAVSAMTEALCDDYVRVGHRLSIHQRLDRLRGNKSHHHLVRPLECLRHEPITSPRTVEITGVGHTGAIPESERRNVFFNADGAGRVGVCSVESIALEHYKATYNLDRGVHGESAVYTTIFGLLFWDIIYKPGIADTFFSSHQTQPLDFQTDLFYERRKEDIDLRLTYLRELSSQELEEELNTVYTHHYSECSVCVHWEVFDSAQDALGLMLCLGMPTVACLCERLVKNYRFCRSGLPDLTMWNSATKQYKIVEVKGPNDKLSTKQILWLDWFAKNGVDAEVCHVRVAPLELSKRFTT